MVPINRNEAISNLILLINFNLFYLLLVVVPDVVLPLLPLLLLLVVVDERLTVVGLDVVVLEMVELLLLL